jgi:hypothetical protein
MKITPSDSDATHRDLVHNTVIVLSMLVDLVCKSVYSLSADDLAPSRRNLSVRVSLSNLVRKPIYSLRTDYYILDYLR